MKMPRFRVTLRLMMVMIAAIAVLIPWLKEMMVRRTDFLSRAASIRANEKLARVIVSTPNIDKSSQNY